MKWFILLLSFKAFALEVKRPQFPDRMELKIIRVETDSFGTYLLTTDRLTEMSLVCAGNITYDKNPKAFIEFRNYYREVAGHFIIYSNKVCQEMGRFIEMLQNGVSEERPFLLRLNRKSMKVEKITFPKLDPFMLEPENDKVPASSPRVNTLG